MDTTSTAPIAPCMFRPGHAGDCMPGVPQADELCTAPLPDFYGKPINTPAGHRWAGTREPNRCAHLACRTTEPCRYTRLGDTAVIADPYAR